MIVFYIYTQLDKQNYVMLKNDGCYDYLTNSFCMFTLPLCPDAAGYHLKVDANGNCETGDKVSPPGLFFFCTFNPPIILKYY